MEAFQQKGGTQPKHRIFEGIMEQMIILPSPQQSTGFHYFRPLMESLKGINLNQSPHHLRFLIELFPSYLSQFLQI